MTREESGTEKEVLKSTTLSDGRRVEYAHALPGDAAAVLEYFEAVAAETDFLSFGAGECGKTVAQEMEYIESLSNRSSGLMLLATVDELIVGVATAGRSPRTRIRHVAELGLTVRRQYWGCGIAKTLCQTLFAEAKRAGVDKFTLRVRADNARGIPLYERLGFVQEGRAADAFRANGISYDELIMGLKI